MGVNEFKFAEAFTEFTLRDSKFKRGIMTIRGSLLQLQKRLDTAAIHARRFLLVSGGALATFVKFAADAEEAASRFNAVFRDQARDVRRWSEELGESVGRSGRAIRNTIASFQAFFKGLGMTGQEAAALSKKMQALAIDFGSFNNMADSEAVQRFISALSGSSEVVDMFGINLKQAALQQELLTMGVTESVLQAKEQEKVLARVNIIYRAMDQQGAIGDAARTADSMTNTMRKLKDAFVDMGVEIGNVFIPTAQRIAKVLIDAVKAIRGLDKSTMDSIATWTTFGVVAAGAIIVVSALSKAVAGLALIVGVAGGGIGLVGGIVALGAAIVGLGSVWATAEIKGESFTETLEKMAKSLLGVETSADRAKASIERMQALKPKTPTPSTEPRPVTIDVDPTAGDRAERARVARSLDQARAERDAAEKARAAARAFHGAKVQLNPYDVLQGVQDIVGGIMHGQLRKPRTALQAAEEENLPRVVAAINAVNELTAEIARLDRLIAKKAAAQATTKTDERADLLAGSKPFFADPAMAAHRAQQMIGREVLQNMLADAPRDLGNMWSRFVRNTIPDMITAANRVQRGAMDLGRKEPSGGAGTLQTTTMAGLRSLLEQMRHQSQVEREAQRERVAQTKHLEAMAEKIGAVLRPMFGYQ